MINSAALKDYKQRIKQAPTVSTMDGGEAAVIQYAGGTLIKCEVVGVDCVWHFTGGKDDPRLFLEDYRAGQLVLSDAKVFFESARAVMNAKADAEEARGEKK